MHAKKFEGQGMTKTDVDLDKNKGWLGLQNER
jgi:hypothetical protein